MSDLEQIKWAVDVFNKYGIETKIHKTSKIIISNYCQPKDKTFFEIGINENELIKNVIACSNRFDTHNSKITEFPLVVCQELLLAQDSEIKEMPNLKAVGKFLVNSYLKKLPKLTAAACITLENSKIRTIPKLIDVGILVAQTSEIMELPKLENAKKICIIDCPIKDLKSLKNAEDIFICSSEPDNRIELSSLKKLEKVDNLFAANVDLKSLPALKTAKKIALYNCKVKNIKSSLKAEIEIKNEIADEELANKFESFINFDFEKIIQKEFSSINESISN